MRGTAAGIRMRIEVGMLALTGPGVRLRSRRGGWRLRTSRGRRRGILRQFEVVVPRIRDLRLTMRRGSAGNNGFAGMRMRRGSRRPLVAEVGIGIVGVEVAMAEGIAVQVAVVAGLPRVEVAEEEEVGAVGMARGGTGKELMIT
jgi:hypothetical protein